MATSKKPTTKSAKTTPKKTTTRKTATAKKSSVKKAPVRSRSTATKKPKTQQLESFKVSAPTEPFMTFRLNRQTAYWLALGIVVLGMGAWILKLQSDIQYIYDQIEVSNSQSDAAEAQIQLRTQQKEN